MQKKYLVGLFNLILTIPVFVTTAVCYQATINDILPPHVIIIIMRNPESFSVLKNNEESSGNVDTNNSILMSDEVGEEHDAVPTLEVSDEIKPWLDGIDLDTKYPKPFQLDLQDFYNQDELKNIVADKTKTEAEEILHNNHEAILKNNEAIEQFDEHVFQISELRQSELEELYNSEQTNDSDKSIISCIEIIRSAYKQGIHSDDELDLLKNIQEATNYLYSFGVLESQAKLEKEDSHFRILTEKEREKVEPGSLDDLASAALESFVRNPNYSNSRIVDYDNYLYGIQLDCTKRKVVKKNGTETIKEELDLEEFQERIIESMSWALLDEESIGELYSEEEFADLQERSADLYADHVSGHHFRTDAEENDGRVYVRGRGQWGEKNIYGFNYDDKMPAFLKRFKKRIRSNNDEVFKYNSELARIETKPWADKIDLDVVDRYNNDEKLSCERKFELITAYMQKSLNVQNLDENGQEQPIGVKWFRYKESKATKYIKKLLNISIENEELPEEYAGAYYLDSEKSIYYIKPSPSKKKLTNHDIGTIAHEMWHAKQHETIQGKDIWQISTEDLKTRMYMKNDLGYDTLERRVRKSGNKGYYMQIMEREAYAIGGQIKSRFEKRQQKKRGKRILKSLF